MRDAVDTQMMCVRTGRMMSRGARLVASSLVSSRCVCAGKLKRFDAARPNMAFVTYEEMSGAEACLRDLQDFEIAPGVKSEFNAHTAFRPTTQRHGRSTFGVRPCDAALPYRSQPPPLHFAAAVFDRLTRHRTLLHSHP